MRFQFSPIVALLLLLLTGHSLARYNQCYTGGQEFEDLGTDEEINKALSDVCAKMAEKDRLSFFAYDCINVNHDRINVVYDITNASTRPDELRVSQWNCVDMFTQVKNKCYGQGGELYNINTDDESEGGNWFTAHVRVDPQRDHC